MGLAISTGHPLGVITAAAMPVVCLATGSRKGAFNGAFGYYLAALWPMIPGLERYIARSVTIVEPVALWAFGAALLALPWTIAATTHRRQYFWRAPLALLATVVPPLGIIGVASPITAAGYLFPGSGWAGLALVAFLPGIVLATEALTIRQRWILRCFVLALCLGLRISGWNSRSDVPDAPRGWIAVNTHSGDLSQPFHDFIAAQFIHEKAAESSARVIIFPEAVVPAWSAATEAFWRQSLDRCRMRGQILAIGAGLPAARGIDTDDPQKLTDLQLYDFGPAADALRTMRAGPLHTISAKPRPERTDNTMLVVGAELAKYYQRVPVPVGMWRPFSRTSVPLRLTAPGIVTIDHQRAAVLICYEQMITFPILASMLQRPTVIVGISNTFWVNGTTIPRFQATALRGWARLFRLPFLLAVNS